MRKAGRFPATARLRRPSFSLLAFADPVGQDLQIVASPFGHISRNRCWEMLACSSCDRSLTLPSAQRANEGLMTSRAVNLNDNLKHLPA